MPTFPTFLSMNRSVYNLLLTTGVQSKDRNRNPDLDSLVMNWTAWTGSRLYTRTWFYNWLWSDLDMLRAGSNLFHIFFHDLFHNLLHHVFHHLRFLDNDRLDRLRKRFDNWGSHLLDCLDDNDFLLCYRMEKKGVNKNKLQREKALAKVLQKWFL